MRENQHTALRETTRREEPTGAAGTAIGSLVLGATLLLLLLVWSARTLGPGLLELLAQRDTLPAAAEVHQLQWAVRAELHTPPPAAGKRP